MKKVLITLLSTLILSTYAFAAIPVQVLDQKIGKVNSNINWTNTRMAARQVSISTDIAIDLGNIVTGSDIEYLPLEMLMW